MARNQKAKALARLKEYERRTKKGGQVVVVFNDPVHKVPWYRAATENDRIRVFPNAVCEVVPTPTATLIRVSQPTDHGDIVRLYDWSEIQDVTIVPPLLPKTEEGPLA